MLKTGLRTAKPTSESLSFYTYLKVIEIEIYKVYKEYFLGKNKTIIINKINYVKITKKQLLLFSFSSIYAIIKIHNIWGSISHNP